MRFLVVIVSIWVGIGVVGKGNVDVREDFAVASEGA